MSHFGSNACLYANEMETVVRALATSGWLQGRGGSLWRFSCIWEQSRVFVPSFYPLSGGGPASEQTQYWVILHVVKINFYYNYYVLVIAQSEMSSGNIYVHHASRKDQEYAITVQQPEFDIYNNYKTNIIYIT